MDTRALDAYLTRAPYWYDDGEPPIYRCIECSGFLSNQPDEKREVITKVWCDGKPHVITCQYNDGTHEGILAIIGEEFREKTYEYATSPTCGTKEGGESGSDLGSTEIRSEDAPEWNHSPHWTYSPFGCYFVNVRHCRKCGHANEEREI